ncbi:MAG: hypothetical protein Q8S00_08655 [Deltaproteobacteria bacterium]|nr:hypothetical protein [Deltaproteobacteria bacterium]MDZ4345866.1 hypothetical protein [Candidatus Binatia bacterium]
MKTLIAPLGVSIENLKPLTRERLKEMERLIEETLASVAKPVASAVHADLRRIYDSWRNPRGRATIDRNIPKN